MLWKKKYLFTILGIEMEIKYCIQYVYIILKLHIDGKDLL